MAQHLLPLFVNLAGRRVVLVGGGGVAAAKLTQLRAAQADVIVIAPRVHPSIEGSGVRVLNREFTADDLDGAWLVVAAATPEVNRAVAAAAEGRRVFVNAVDDPANATAFMGGVVRRGGVTVAISTSGEAPGLSALLREALDVVLPQELGRWVQEARRCRQVWRRDKVPIADRKPLLLEALNGLYDSSTTVQGSGSRFENEAVVPPGHVSLVGAGPGDPALLTRAAVARLRRADLVLYDALVDERVVRLARRAQRFFVGKRSGRYALTQREIDAVMIAAARRGRRVVRLKGGDPFVFGRGGEEALALIGAGVAFDVVPGVTSISAAPALAGIPVTHRGVASALLVVSGHDPRMFEAVVGNLLPQGVTLVVVMGLMRRDELAAILIGRGWPPHTPAALVAEASMPNQQVWRGTLAELATGRAVVHSDGPAMIVVGDVAALNVSATGALGSADDQAALAARTGASP